MANEYTDEDIFEVFDVNEWWGATSQIGDVVADFFSDWENVDRADFQQAIDEICDELNRVIFDEALFSLNGKGVELD